MYGTSYAYDQFDRLTAGVYGQNNNGNWQNTDYYSSSYAYDDRGNITNLVRKQMSSYLVNNCRTVELIDDMQYTYGTSSNQVTQILDTAPCPKELTLPDTIWRNRVFYAEDIYANHTIIDARAVVDLYNKNGLTIFDTMKIAEHSSGIANLQTNHPGCTDGTNSTNTAGFAQQGMGNYAYDDAGNMTHDPNKNVNIFYDHHNKPYKYVSTGGIPEEVHIQYDALGNKLLSKVMIMSRVYKPRLSCLPFDMYICNL